MMEYNVTPWTKEGWNIPISAVMCNRYLQTSQEVRARAEVCAAEDALLVHMSIRCPQVRAVEEGPLGMPCEDSCLEFFFCPVPGDERYFNFEWNANSCLFLGIGTGIEDLTRLVPDDPQALFAPQIQRDAGGWSLEYRIPYHFIRRFFPTFAPAGTIRGNFYACSDLSKPAYYLSWNPVEGQTLSFHRPKCFGKLHFISTKEI